MSGYVQTKFHFLQLFSCRNFKPLWLQIYKNLPVRTLNTHIGGTQRWQHLRSDSLRVRGCESSVTVDAVALPSAAEDISSARSRSMSYTSVVVAEWAFRLIRIGLFRAMHHGAMIHALQFRVEHIASDDMSDKTRIVKIIQQKKCPFAKHFAPGPSTRLQTRAGSVPVTSLSPLSYSMSIYLPNLLSYTPSLPPSLHPSLPVVDHAIGAKLWRDRALDTALPSPLCLQLPLYALSCALCPKLPLYKLYLLSCASPCGSGI
jgi:hypothetical protein